jgi:type IV secretory pathway component VirB8
MESMQSELKKSGRRYEDLCEKVRKSDQARAAKIAKLQKRTLMVTSLIGVAVVVALLLVAFGR